MKIAINDIAFMKGFKIPHDAQKALVCFANVAIRLRPSLFATVRILFLVAGGTDKVGSSFKRRETVACEKPDSSAICLIVTIILPAFTAYL